MTGMHLLLTRTVYQTHGDRHNLKILCFPHGGMGDRIVFQAIINDVISNQACCCVVLIPAYWNLESIYSPRDYQPRPAEVWVMARPFWFVQDLSHRATLVDSLVKKIIPEADQYEAIWFGSTDEHGAMVNQFKVVDPYAFIRSELLHRCVYPSYPYGNIRRQEVHSVLTAAGIRPDIDALVAIHCRTFSDSSHKNPSPKQMSLLAHRITSELKVRVIVIGDGDIPIELISYDLLHFVSDPKFTLTAALLSFCKAFVGGDSGPGHLAAALKVSTISIQQRGSEQIWGPFCPPEKLDVVSGRLQRDAAQESLYFQTDEVLQYLQRILDR